MFSFLRSLFFLSRETIATHDPADLRARLEKENPLLVIDVREPSEFAGGHIPGAVNIPLGRVLSHAAELAGRNRPVVAVCLSDMRSRRAAAQLRHAGLRDLAILQGGIFAWVRQGYPFET